jgi:hypothetical protein
MERCVFAILLEIRCWRLLSISIFVTVELGIVNQTLPFVQISLLLHLWISFFYLDTSVQRGFVGLEILYALYDVCIEVQKSIVLLKPRSK